MSTATETRSIGIAEPTGSDLELLLDNVRGYAICILDPGGNIRNWNASAQKLTGYTEKEAIGKPYSLFFANADIQKEMPRKIIEFAAKHGYYNNECVRQKKSGAHYWANVSINAIRDKRRRLLGFAEVTYDATKEKESARQKDEFIGIAAHELKTPITTLSLYTQLLAERLKLEPDKQNFEMVRDIQGQTDRLVRLINDLLTVNTLESNTFILHEDVFDLSAMVRAIAAEVQKASKSHKIIVRGRLVRKVQGDRDRIEQVLTNLLQNAVKYSLRADKVVVGISSKGGVALVSVQDFGLGIAKSDQNRIFDRYFRAHDQKSGRIAGFGLGLYIASEIIKKHGQKIWMKSVKGKGSTFFFTVALA